MTCSIFIDSITTSGCCAATVSPAATWTDTIVPCIGDSTRTLGSDMDTFYRPSEAEDALHEDEHGEDGDDGHRDGGHRPQHRAVRRVAEHRAAVGQDEHERQHHRCDQAVQ